MVPGQTAFDNMHPQFGAGLPNDLPQALAHRAMHDLVSISVAVPGFLAAAFAAPAVLRPLNLVWLEFGILLHRIVNPVIADTQSLGFTDPCCAKGRATFWDPALGLDHQRLARRQRDDLLRLVSKELVDRLLGARTVG